MKKFLICGSAAAFADERMANDSVRTLWSRFCLGGSELDMKAGDPCSFRMGEAELPVLPEGKEYILSVNDKGAAIVGRDYGGLMRGFMALLMKIEFDRDTAFIREVIEESQYSVTNRMIHICVFPENDLYFIKKLVRLAALCQYTHIIIEFWGMIRYDCLKELSWPNAFTKEEAGELIRECRELGIEPVPMFNQLGHATASRLCYGKHVVLDQNPRLQRLFSPDGWVWDIESEEVAALLKAVRGELYELFGEGEYMHIGCDEAYYITRNDRLRHELPNFLGRLTTEVEAEGRKPMMWMDMLLEKDAFAGCYTVGKKDEAAALRAATAPSTVFVDWQYDCSAIPIPSLFSLKDCGHAVMGAPWFDKGNYIAHVETVAQNGMHGVMLTTWHVLKDHMPCILGCAKKCGAQSFVWSESSGLHEETATLLRRISFEGNTYADCGWSKDQIEV